MFVRDIPAAGLPDWYARKRPTVDDHAFLGASPDHHLFRPYAGGDGQEVWETTGGAPFASRFFFVEGQDHGVVTKADPSYDVQMASIATLEDGTPIGGIRHQFRDEPEGTRVLLTVEMPLLLGPYGPRMHRWHLACEFSNWFTMAANGA